MSDQIMEVTVTGVLARRAGRREQPLSRDQYEAVFERVSDSLHGLISDCGVSGQADTEELRICVLVADAGQRYKRNPPIACLLGGRPFSATTSAKNPSSRFRPLPDQPQPHPMRHHPTRSYPQSQHTHRPRLFHRSQAQISCHSDTEGSDSIPRYVSQIDRNSAPTMSRSSDASETLGEDLVCVCRVEA